MKYIRNGFVWNAIRWIGDLPVYLAMVLGGVSLIWLPLHIVNNIRKNVVWHQGTAVDIIIIASSLLVYIVVSGLLKMAYKIPVEEEMA